MIRQQQRQQKRKQQTADISAIINELIENLIAVQTKEGEGLCDDLKQRVDMLEQVDDVVFEELNVLGTLVKDGTENDGKLYTLNKTNADIFSSSVTWIF